MQRILPKRPTNLWLCMSNVSPLQELPTSLSELVNDCHGLPNDIHMLSPTLLLFTCSELAVPCVTPVTPELFAPLMQVPLMCRGKLTTSQAEVQLLMVIWVSLCALQVKICLPLSPAVRICTAFHASAVYLSA